MTTIITSGDDVTLPVQLYKDGQAFAINPAATVKAAITDIHGRTLLAGPVTLSNATSGSDWSIGLVVAPFAKADTASLSPGAVVLEVEVNDDKVLTWHIEGLRVRAGLIA